MLRKCPLVRSLKWTREDNPASWDKFFQDRRASGEGGEKEPFVWGPTPYSVVTCVMEAIHTSPAKHVFGASMCKALGRQRKCEDKSLCPQGTHILLGGGGIRCALQTRHPVDTSKPSLLLNFPVFVRCSTVLLLTQTHNSGPVLSSSLQLPHSCRRDFPKTRVLTTSLPCFHSNGFLSPLGSSTNSLVGS